VYVSKSDALNKVYEIEKKCEEFEEPELRDACKQHYHTITSIINTIYKYAENCDPYLISAMYVLGVDAGELLREVTKQLGYGFAKDINDILYNTVKILIRDIDKLLKEKCGCKLLELGITE
jgi:hypothetical protein